MSEKEFDTIEQLRLEALNAKRAQLEEARKQIIAVAGMLNDELGQSNSWSEDDQKTLKRQIRENKKDLQRVDQSLKDLE